MVRHSSTQLSSRDLARELLLSRHSSFFASALLDSFALFELLAREFGLTLSDLFRDRLFLLLLQLLVLEPELLASLFALRSAFLHRDENWIEYGRYARLRFPRSGGGAAMFTWNLRLSYMWSHSLGYSLLSGIHAFRDQQLGLRALSPNFQSFNWFVIVRVALMLVDSSFGDVGFRSDVVDELLRLLAAKLGFLCDHSFFFLFHHAASPQVEETRYLMIAEECVRAIGSRLLLKQLTPCRLCDSILFAGSNVPAPRRPQPLSLPPSKCLRHSDHVPLATLDAVPPYHPHTSFDLKNELLVAQSVLQFCEPLVLTLDASDGIRELTLPVHECTHRLHLVALGTSALILIVAGT
ncbi:hypothetical protein PINS_up010545 [Pythium insidiosum]|nr:hypothetical protein PINS_up010545 [Pythium insidiosum]